MTSFSQLHLSRNSCSRRSLDKINLHFELFILIKKGEKRSIFFVGMENFTFKEMHVGEKSKRKSFSWNSLTARESIQEKSRGGFYTFNKYN